METAPIISKSKGDKVSQALKILVVDDQEEDLNFIVSLLREEDFLAEGLDNSTCPIPDIRSNRPDLILLDYNMPRLSGAKLIQQIRSEND